MFKAFCVARSNRFDFKFSVMCSAILWEYVCMYHTHTHSFFFIEISLKKVTHTAVITYMYTIKFRCISILKTFLDLFY